MVNGLVRCFYILEEKEVNLRLLCDGSAVLAYSSFIQQSPSQEYIQCLADCEGYVFSLKDIDSVRKHVPQIELYRRMMAERHYLSMERRLFTLQFKTAEEKYQHFFGVYGSENCKRYSCLSCCALLRCYSRVS